MRTYQSWQDEYKSKLVTAEEAVKHVKSKDVVTFGLALGGPTAHIVDALLARADELEKVRIFDAVSVRPMKLYDPHFMNTIRDSFTYSSVLFTPVNRKLAGNKSNVDYQSINSSDTGRRIARFTDVAMVSVCRPEGGRVNLGLTNFYTPEMIRGAKIKIAEVNDEMPMVYGENWMNVSDFDFFVEHNSPIPEMKRKGEPSALEFAIAENVASLIKDGDCIQMGIGTLPEAIVKLLHNKGKKDLGVHTEMFPMGLPALVKDGIVTNKLKTLHTGKVVATFCMGNVDMYDFVTRNSDCVFFPASYINSPYVIKEIDNMVAINMDLEIDLMGQMNCEMIDYRLIGGAGGQLDFVIGAAWSRGGRAINVLPSTRTLKTGEVVSTIVPSLAAGSPVAIPHMYSQFVVTEYGVADLFYRTWRERAEALISIAHPDFRAELRKEAKRILK